MKNRFFALTLLIFCFVAASSAQENRAKKLYEFKGIVKTPDSAVYAGIPLYFNRDGQENFVFTNINGEFSTRLAPGNYEVTVRKTLSDTFRAFVSIQENGLNPNNVEFIVKPKDEALFPAIVKLAKPPYPAAARAVRAWGEVVVEVKIDREGKVNSANAISGHPLLRAIAVTAAKSSVFETSSSDEPRESRLTYVFLFSEDEKSNVKRYTNPKRVEVFSVIELIVNTFDTKTS